MSVGPISSGNTSTGVATAIVQYDIGNANSSQFTLGVVVTGVRYKRQDPSDSVTINVVKPGIANTMTIAGALGNIGSMGLLVGATVSSLTSTQTTATMSGFVQYNKSGTNPQGAVLLYMHSFNKPDGTPDSIVHTYLVKTNAIAQLIGLGGGAGGFSAKASITDVTNPSAVVGVDGGAVVQINLTHASTVTWTGSTYQSWPTVAVSVQSSKGGLWYAGQWDGVKSVAKPIFAGATNPGKGVAIVQ